MAGDPSFDGLIVDKVSQADIAGNGSDAIEVRDNSGVNLRTDTTGATPSFSDDTNTGQNLDRAVRCRIGSYATGALGTLDITDVTRYSDDGTCIEIPSDFP